MENLGMANMSFSSNNVLVVHNVLTVKDLKHNLENDSGILKQAPIPHCPYSQGLRLKLECEDRPTCSRFPKIS